MFINVFLTITPPADTHKWRLVHKQIMNDNIVKHSFNDIKYVLIGEVTVIHKYCIFINTYNYIIVSYNPFSKCGFELRC